MQPAGQWMSNCPGSLRPWVFALSLALAVLQLGCAMFAADQSPKTFSPAEKVFKGGLEEVWRAIMLALQTPKSYPLKVSNIDTGTIETEPLRGATAYSPPFAENLRGAGYSYRIVIQVIKGDLGAEEAYRVTVSKFAQIERDFISQPQTVESDGFEEQGIIYRIGRELAIDRGLQRAQSRKSKKK